jgi:hypothetical protein
MRVAEQTWEEVGASWRDLGRHLQEQYRKLGEDEARETHEDREKLNAAAQRLSEHLSRALGSMGEVVKDPQTKQSMDRVIHAMGDAISSTFDDVAEEIRRHLPRRAGEQPSEARGAAAGAESVDAGSGQEGSPPA